MRLRVREASDWRVWAAFIAPVVLLVIDLLTPNILLLPFYALPVLGVATIASARTTAVVLVISMAASIVAGGFRQGVQTDYWLRETGLLGVCLIGVLLAHLRSKATRKLSESETRFRLLAENSANVVLLSREHAIVWISPSVEDMLGWRPSEVVGTLLEDFLHSDDASRGFPDGRGPGGGADFFRLRVRAKDGTYRWIEVQRSPFVNDFGDQDGFVSSFRTIDSEVATEEELQRRATHDDLTGLLSRGEVIKQLESILNDRRRPEPDCSVLFCDLDRFKAINDTHGHLAGDLVLRAIATRLQASVRAEDLVARIGGDEFLVVLNGVRSMDEAMSIAEMVHFAVTTEPISIEHDLVAAAVSIGVTLVASGEDADSIITRADSAMYEAKRSGADPVVAIAPQFRGSTRTE